MAKYIPKPKPVIEDLPNEKWEEMAGYPNFLISNMGRVKNLRRGTLKKPSDDGSGYDILTLWVPQKQRGICKRLARLVYESFIPCGCKNTIDHINGNKRDNRLENLRCVSMKENAANKPKIEKNNKYNLDPVKKGIIAKHLRNKTKTTWELMKEYGIPMKYLRAVRQRGSWLKHIKDEEL